MAINLKDLKPTKVSKDLKGKFVFLYGTAKIGKTTLACQFPKNLILGFEHGWNLINNAMAVDVPSWAEFKKYVKQLSDNEMKDMFNTITIDTIGQGYDKCTAYICDREGVDKIGDIPFGGGYNMVDKEFSDTLTKITQNGYGIVLIGHEKVRVDTDGSISYKHIAPDMPERCAKIINRMVDMIAYIGMENGTRYIYPRQVNIEEGKQITEIYAGSRFSGLNSKIELGYDSLVNAISDAMEDSAKSGGYETVEAPVQLMQEVKLDFGKIKAEIGKIVRVLAKADEGLDDQIHMTSYRSIVEEYLGKGRLVKDCDESQVDHLSLIVEDLKAYAANNNIKL